MTPLPLAGYRVLELAHLIAGPVCGMYLADMGADVVKVEHPVDGDASRVVYGTQYGAESAVFVTVNRNKRSVAIDLGRAEGLALFRRLVASTDVVIEAYRGGVAQRLGVDYAALAPLNPRLVYCSVSAFGPEGPWRDKPGLDISLLNGALLAHAARLSMFLATGEEPGRWGSGHPYMVPFQALPARDGFVYVAVWRERLWRPFCEAIGDPSLADDPRFATREARLARRAELTARLESIFRQATVREWMERLEARDVLCAPVNRYADLPGDPAVRATGMLTDEDHPRAGRIRTLATPIRFSETPGSIRAPSPTLGEHTDAVLGEAGVTSAELAHLKRQNVIA